MTEQTLMASFVRHDLDPAAVALSVAEKIAKIERNRIISKQDAAEARTRRAAMSERDLRRESSRAPATDGAIDERYDKFVAAERDHYSTVRIIESISDPLDEKRYRLVYGDVEDSATAPGTGPFESVERATAWFANNGR